ncbi:hypothetical protein MNV49_000580 [Pseudohyphozyma bogoriensis]|nr:hypothetical protein MNV49_000580 [Pseudohyphozyma bogoriensis]
MAGIALPSRLAYKIHSASGHTSTFTPEHILHDLPTDQASRWTGATSATLDDKPSSSTPSSTSGRRSPAIPLTPNDGNSPNSHKTFKREVQYIILELEQPAVVQRIGFGKYHKTHPCNLAEFSVSGGLSPNPRYMELLYHGGLKNDSQKETFDLKTSNKNSRLRDDVLLPVKYLRIDAYAAHSINYNVSIWHVWLEGDASPTLMPTVLSTYDDHVKTVTSQVLLAHLRRSFLLSAFSTLLTTLPTSITSTFEHPLVSALHTSLVLRGQFTGPDGAEVVLEEMIKEGLFDEWGRNNDDDGGKGKGKSVARWENLEEVGAGVGQGPSPRGGHQMVRVGRKLLLHGGWDGSRDLGDLWELELPRSTEGDGAVGTWRCLNDGLGGKVGEEYPKARSCHQLAVDESEGWVYLLGGIWTIEGEEEWVGKEEPMDEGAPPVVERDGEEEGETGRASNGVDGDEDMEVEHDVSAEGGPKLLFDHQMIVHSGAGMIYVFGGKHVEPVANSDAVEGVFSGMFAYSIERKTWSALLYASLRSGDPTPTDAFKSERLLSRIGHSMLLDTSVPSLFILGGQRGESYLSDLWTVQLATPSSDDADEDAPPPQTSLPTLWRSGAVIDPSSPTPTIVSTKMLSLDYSKEDGPPAGFTQRTNLDAETGEWTMLSGLRSDKRGESPTKDVWRRSRNGDWEQVELRGDYPVGRFAAPVMYDPLRKEHYLMGGNPQDPVDDLRRLGDLWRLKVVKPSPEEALRMAKFLVRKQRFNEMCQTEPTLNALAYLQTTLSSVVDHTDESEASAFRNCMASLLAAPASNNFEDPMDDDSGSEAGQLAESTTSDFSALSESQRLAKTEIKEELFNQRHELFETLLDFFPEKDRQPREDLKEMAMPRWNEVIKGRFD